MVDIFFHHDLDEHHDYDVARGFEQAIIIPRRVLRRQLACQPVVFAQEQRVHHRRLRHGVDPVPTHCKQRRLAGRRDVLQAQRQIENGKFRLHIAIGAKQEGREFLAVDHLAFQPATGAGPQRPRLRFGATVERRQINLVVRCRAAPIFLVIIIVQHGADEAIGEILRKGREQPGGFRAQPLVDAGRPRKQRRGGLQRRPAGADALAGLGLGRQQPRIVGAIGEAGPADIIMLGGPRVRPVAAHIHRAVDDQAVDLVIQIKRIQRLGHNRQ